MEKLTEFVMRHMSDDTARLVLDRAKWPEIDMELAVNCIESRRKLRGKVRQWYDEPRLIFPYKLSAEQCSGSSAALYKASLAARIATHHSGLALRHSGLALRHSGLALRHSGLDPEYPAFRLADLTGGLGVDSWYFSGKAEAVLYNEMQEKLCESARYNFRILGSDNITCRCSTAVPGGIATLLDGFNPDVVYMDPARRGEGGRKVFLLEDCTPDVLTLKDEIFGLCRHILLKLSPMADITMVCSRLGNTCREVHVVASGGECKELLVWMDREWTSEYTITAVELPAHHSGHEPESPSAFTFTPAEERAATCTLSSSGLYLFEPGKSIMKAGAFNTISNRLCINKLGQSTHYYLTDDTEKAASLTAYGKIFKVLSSSPLDKRSIKAAAHSFPNAEVTARNIPMTTEALRKKLGCSPSDTYHIFGLKSDLSGPLLIVTERLILEQR